MTSYSIIIPTKNHLGDCLQPCLESIIKFTDFSTKNVEIIVVSNGSTDNTDSYIHGLSSNTYIKNLKIKLLTYPEALGFVKATNIGAKEATGEYLILLNNDTELKAKFPDGDWIDQLVFPFNDNKYVGATGKMMLKQYGIKFILGFCLMIKKSVMQDMGYLDEIFGIGFGDDIDLSQKLNEHCYWLVTVNLPMIHKGEQTVWEERDKWEEHVKDNVKIIKERYNYLQSEV